MATKLKNLHLTSVDLVREGANQKADICIFKSNDSAQPEKPAEKKGASWFFRWWKDRAADESKSVLSGPENYEYLDAITASIESIIKDNRLAENEKVILAGKSLYEYHEKMLEFMESSVCDNNGKEEIDEIMEV